MKNKYFDKYAIITTKDNKKYNIKKIRFYIAGKKHYYGKKYVIFPDKEEFHEEVHLLNEIYSFDNSIIRYLSDTFKNPVILNTIEHTNNNSEEKPITVIQEYEENKTEILSIPEIVKFESDLMVIEHNKIKLKDKEKEKERKKGIKMLILRKDDNNKKAA